MIRRSCSLHFLELPYTTLIVGGGTSGCLLAGKLAMAGHRVAVIEEGVNLTKLPRWHFEVPASRLLHRASKSGYEKSVLTTPQRGYNREETTPLTIPYPKVLGGSGVMGGKAWVHGARSDWDGMGVDFKKDVRVAFQEIEGIATPLPFRGKRGKFFVSRPATLSPIYKPLSETLTSMQQPFINEFINEKGTLPAGVGRPEVLVDTRNCVGHSTLRSYLLEALNLKRDVTMFTETKATAVCGSGGKVTGVELVGKDGKSFTIEAKRVILAANPVGNALLLQNSKDLQSHMEGAASIGSNFYDRPTVVLQYKSYINNTHQMLDNSFVRMMALFDWQMTGRACAVTSAYDDMVCYWSSEGVGSCPDVRISLQPFAVNNAGTFNGSADHAMQFTIELLRPHSRGSVSSEGVNPNYYSDERDRVVMKEAVAFVKKIASHASMKGYLECADPIAELEEGSGLSGGTLSCGTVVQEGSFEVKGVSGLFVGDSSVHPQPMFGSQIATTVATSLILSETVLNVSKKANNDSDKAPNSHPGKVGGQDGSEQKFSNKVKVTYY